MNVVEVLRKMEKLLAVPEHWTQSAGARDELGDVVSPTSGTAVCWCIGGAMVKVLGRVYPTDQITAVEAALNKTVYRRGFSDGYTDYNDTYGRTHAEVLTLVRETRERLEREGHPTPCA